MPTEPGGPQEFLGIRFDDLPMEAVLDRLAGVTPDSPFCYVVTPNVDHAVRLASADRHDDGRTVQAAYDSASFRLCDSRVLAALARLCGIGLPVVPGSDLTVRLFADVIRAGDRIMIVGGDAGLPEALRALHPAVSFDQHRPPMGLRRDAAALDAAADRVARSGARFAFLAVGSPQQELLAHRIALRGNAGGCALCIGAALRFIVGDEIRAPRLIQKLGLEWAYRLGRDPVRLWRRYLVDGPRIFGMVWRWRRARMGGR